MIERIYYTDQECRAFSAVVRRAFEHEGRPAVTLDRTAFYPTSGGQPSDTGRLDDIEVIDAIDAGAEIVHVAVRRIEPGTVVTGKVDWPRRFDHMQQHTGQHLLSAAVERIAGRRTVSFHMGAEVSTIDLDGEPASSELDRALDLANQVIWENRPVGVRFVTPGEASRLILRRDPARDGLLRLIDIAEFDLSACGGTHVARTGSIGMLAVVGAERVRGGSRLTFVCGGRAVRMLRGYREAVTGAVRALSVLPGELPAAVERLQAEVKDLRKAAGRLRESLARHEAGALVARGEPVGGVTLVAEVLDASDAAGLKTMALALAERPGAAAVLVSSATPASVAIARSADVGLDAGAAIRELTARFGGRGGGKPDLAQGGGLAGTAQEIRSFARQLLREWLDG